MGLLAACSLILASVALLGWTASIPPCPEGIGQPPAEFTLQDTDGHPQSFQATDGKVQILYFWSIRQTSCHAANKAMADLYEKVDHTQVRILGIHAPTADTADAVAVQAALDGLNFPILMDHNGDVTRLYHATDLPAICVVGTAGLVRSFGAFCPKGINTSKISPAQLEAQIKLLIHESKGDSNTTQALANASGQPK
ncbi:MAG: TlpA family protein disulfide reductase [Phycisphaerales bacterium]|nr:TlpA family protein disulfide reductase [Phycisphaerales bacterium]